MLENLGKFDKIRGNSGKSREIISIFFLENQKIEEKSEKSQKSYTQIAYTNALFVYTLYFSRVFFK